MKSSRRNFLQRAALGGAAGMFTFIPSEVVAERRKRSSVAASDRIRFGVIGCNGMGWTNMRILLNIDEVECTALCDVDQSVLDRRAKNAEDVQGKKPALYKDYRKLLDDDSIDAVIIATPDHWHCKMMVDAVEAGKHVYVEKPLANSIQECNIMVDAVERTGKIVQVGQWQRSARHYKSAMDYVHSGKLGQIRLVKVWAYQGWMKPILVKPDSNPPPGVDYDLWLGPAPKRAFNPNRFHFNYRWFWDYSGGMQVDWGVHEIDIALQIMQATAPKSITASGGKLAYPDDASETPDTLQSVFEYDNFNLLWEHATGIDVGNFGTTEGIAFIGNNGTLALSRQGWKVLPEKEFVDGVARYKMESLPNQPAGGFSEYVEAHARNFIEAMQTNNPGILAADVVAGKIAASNGHMGNIAYKTGRKVYWDAARGNFGADAEANALMNTQYHNGWTLPGK
ncbi:MAG: Gfo/Idh/MocA family oxidoreductase [Bacteroidota bacterium]